MPENPDLGKTLMQFFAKAAAVDPQLLVDTARAIDGALAANDMTLEYAKRSFVGVWQWFENYCEGLEGKRLLELGPGHTLAVGALLVANGARSYVGADLFPIAAQDSALFARLREQVSDHSGTVLTREHTKARWRAIKTFDEIVDTNQDVVQFDSDRLRWDHPVDASALPYEDESFEIVFSNAAFEHFRDPERAITETLRVLAPGGYGVHQIDLRDHRNFDSPWEFLCEEQWDEIEQAQCDFEYTNRWRKSDFVKAFERNGATITFEHRFVHVEPPPNLRERLAPQFAELSDEDLHSLDVFLVTQKPDSNG